MTTTRKTTLAAALALTLTLSFAANAQFRDRDRDRSGGDRNDRSRFGDRSQRNGSTSGSNSSTPSTTQPSQSDSGSTRPAEYRERYAILAERNIFLKERRGTREPPRFDGPREPRPEQTFSLTGIVEEEGQFRAYFENLRNPSFTRVSLGDPIARGKVTAIALDAVEYEQDGQRRWIEIGHDLTGTRTVAPSSSYTSSATSSPTTGPTTGPTTATLDFDPNDPALTTEQKMKLKRMKEQGLIK